MQLLSKKTIFLPTIIITIALVGCSSTGSKNTQFVSQEKASSKPSRTIYICRPNAFFNHGLNSMGVIINSQPSFDLGSGERYLLALPVGATTIEILTPTGNIPRYGKPLVLKVPDQIDATYIIVDNDTVNWRAQNMGRLSYEKACGVEANKTIFITDKSLN